MKATRFMFAVAFLSATGLATSVLAALPTFWNQPTEPKAGAWIEDFENYSGSGTLVAGFTGGRSDFFTQTDSMALQVTTALPFADAWNAEAEPMVGDAVYVQFAMQNVVFVGDDPTEVNKPFFVVEEGEEGSRLLAVKYWNGSMANTVGAPVLDSGIADEVWFTVTVKKTAANIELWINGEGPEYFELPAALSALPKGIKVVGEGLIDNLLASYGDPLRDPLYTPPPGADEGLDGAVLAYASELMQSVPDANTVSMSTQNGDITASTVTAADVAKIYDTAYLLGATLEENGDEAMFAYELGISGIAYNAVANATEVKIQLTVNGAAVAKAIPGTIVLLKDGTSVGSKPGSEAFTSGEAVFTVPGALSSRTEFTVKVVAPSTEP